MSDSDSWMYERLPQHLVKKPKKQKLKQQVESQYPPEMAAALSSNAPPQEDAVRATRAFRQEPAEALRILDSKISDIDKQVESLQKQKQSPNEEAAPHRIRVKACDNVFSPIRHVPFDILSEIMLYALPARPFPQQRSVPLSASHVCSAWRTAALSSPHLWTTLFLKISGSGRFGIYEALVEEWLKRAKGLPLSFFIHFRLRGGKIDEDIAGFRPLLRSFAHFAPHIRHLGIGAYWVHFVFRLFLDMDPDWDLRGLERLDFCSSGAELYNEDSVELFDRPKIEPVVIFKQAPLLRKLAIKNTLMTCHNVSNVLPWSRLTNVHIEEGLTVDYWIQVMVLSPQMQVGRFYIRDTFVVNFLHQPTREHLHLENLSLRILYDYPHPVDLIKSFTFPKLNTLTLANNKKMRSEGLPSPRDLPQFSSLRSLSLQTWTYPVEYLIELLQQVQGLEMLEVHFDSDIYPQLLSALIYSPPCTILPRLSTLRLSNFYDQLLDSDTIYDMVRSRCLNMPPEFQPLKCLYIYLIGTSRHLVADRQELVEKLKSCVDAGLILVIPDTRRSSNWLVDLIPRIRDWEDWSPSL
ncbi:hypothetical protein GALMADRAFT_243089 [Galerina marginata CBS 339.88]|uniref:Uncharacterized protein n=1 Tax=Galerina marginata (strain CBS 339.88) TaxID=685588 RepID=A0A067T7L0_GALM3|nr:hypothetical protein GALMADRAFT_243089 [Galerina marginata CBS 339.88]